MSAVDVALSPILKESVLFPGNLINQARSSEPILVYLCFSGSVIPMPILESDSIASVKLRIQTCKGFVAKKQKLVYGGRELARNDSLVKDYGMTGGDVLHLVLRISDLLLITVQTACGDEFLFHVDRHCNIRYLKKRIAIKGKGFADVCDQDIFCNGEKLDDQRLVDDIRNDNDAVIHLLVQKSAKVRAIPVEKDLELSVVAADVTSDNVETDFLLKPITVNPKVKLPKSVWDMLQSTFAGLEKGNQPIRSSEGTGGTYLMQDSSGLNYVSVFKPNDEEPMAVNNPRGLPVSTDGQGLKRGTRVGEGAVREVAAYILDHPKSGPGEGIGFAGVPPTVMVNCGHKGFYNPQGCDEPIIKTGSLQMFMKNNGSCEDMGPGAFPVDEVHKISVFDIRMANADRHAGNILIGKGQDGQTVLIPIDHGYCLPENFEDCTFDWLYWPQAQECFSLDTVEYIKRLDAERDVALLRYHGWKMSVECCRTLHISTMLLKKGAERCLTPFTIGNMMCRETVNKESAIEEIVKEAKDLSLPGTSEAAFLETVSHLMDYWLDNLTK